MVLKKVHRVIEFYQNAWLKLNIDMDSDLRKKAKNNFEKFFSLSSWIMKLFEKLWKIWENVEILCLLQQKIEETVWFQNQAITLQTFSQKFYYQQKWKNAYIYE